MEISPAVQAAPLASTQPPLERPLPAVVMEDTSIAGQKEHAWPGTFFYRFSYVVGGALGIFSVWLVISSLLLGPDPVTLSLGVGAGLWAALQWRLAREVRHFTRWGWYGAMGEMGVATATKLLAIAQGELVGGVVGLAFDVYVLRYFWDRRTDFGVHDF